MVSLRLAVTIPTMGASHLIDTLASLPPGLPLHLRDNRQDNWGVAKSWNWGIRRALADGADFVLVLNDDVRIETPDFIERLIADLSRDNVILVSGRAASDPPARSDARLTMSAFLCDQRLFQIVGECDETFWPAYFEDDDMLHRVRKTQQYRTYYDSDAVFYHWTSSTIREVGAARWLNRRYFKKNRQHFEDKWGYRPDH